MKKAKLHLSPDTIRVLCNLQLTSARGGISVNCTNAGVNLCVLGCTQPPIGGRDA